MSEEINFQLFNVNKIVQHKIDIHVVTEITEAIHKNRNTLQMSGLLFGRQEGSDFHIKNLVLTQIFDIDVDDNSLGVDSETIQDLVKYAKDVYGLDLIGWFYEANELNTNLITVHSRIVSMSSANILLMLVGLDTDKGELKMNPYYTVTNKHYKMYMATFQRAGIEVCCFENKYGKGKFISLRRCSKRKSRSQLPNLF